MKNLSAFSRFPLTQALMILITLVVCLAGFTKAEVSQSFVDKFEMVNTNYRQHDSGKQKNENFLLKRASFMENFPYTHQASEIRGHELRGKNFFNLKNFPELPLDRPIKRHSDYFGDSDDSDAESDGYGYDDDEYYHFNFKRNDEPNRKIESIKSDKGTKSELQHKGLNIMAANNNNPVCQKSKDNQEFQTIEMLNYQERHPIISQEDSSNPLKNVKPFSDSVSHSKAPSTNPMSSLTGIDFKENPAIDENNKERKEESGVVTTSDSKIVDTKKEVKAAEEKDSGKLKDSKLGEDTEKKEKEAALKGGKESVAAKTLKENSKTSEDKEKAVKLSESAKLKDSLEKISSKSKDSESTKLTKDDKEVSKFTDKINSDVFNANGLSRISSGASFVGNDYKDNLDAMKSIRSEGDRKNSEESQESEKNIGLSEYQEDSKENQEKLKEKQSNSLKNERIKNYEYLNGQSNLMKMLQGTGKLNPYSRGSPNFDYQNSNNFFRKRDPWRETGKMSSKLSQEYQIGQPYQHQAKQSQQQQFEINLEPQMKHTFTNLPANELENTEYHKNYMKSLKKYKNQNDNSKTSSSDMEIYITPEASNLRSAQVENKKKKRSKPKKRSMLPDKISQELEKSQNEHLSEKRNIYAADNFLSDSIQEYLQKPHSSQSLQEIKTNKEDANLLNDKKYFDQFDKNRQRRKSPQKLEYEIKIINQKQPDGKNARFSHFVSNRLKKDVKTKLSTEDKYLKKYPYSQVSRDDLTKISDVRESQTEKKFKRKAPVCKRDDQKSVIQTRAVPSGYYSNRVKFGQKNYIRNNEKVSPDSSGEEMNRLLPTYFSQMPLEPSKNFLQRAWEVKRPNYKHEPTKRFDESQYLSLGNPGDSLLLVKKGERMAKVLQDGSPPKTSENDLSAGQLAKILSEDKNYVVFKKANTEKLKKNNEAEPSSLNLNALGGSSYADKKFTFWDPSSSGIQNNNAWSTPFKSLHTRSSHSEKNDKKFYSAFHNTETKSNLKKAMNKFRDLADFFKDNEQDTTDNQYSTQEAKVGQDIVFSQDKLPDPIVISNDDNNKESSFKQEPVNSIFAISNNFKNLDQQTKKTEHLNNDDTSKNFLTSEIKSDNMESSWKPALQQAFPEAKSINSVTKNGNEIIVLDLNSNKLKVEREHYPFKFLQNGQSREANNPYTSRLLVNNPNQYLTSKAQENTLNDVPYVLQLTPNALSDKRVNDNKMNLLSNDRAVAIIRSADNQVHIPESLREIAELPGLLKKIITKDPMEAKSNVKLVNRNTLNERPQTEERRNLNQFFQGFGKLSEAKIKKEVSLPSKIFSEPSTYDLSVKNLRNVLQSLLNPVSLASANPKGLTFENYKTLLENQKSDQQYQNLAGHQPDVTLNGQGRRSAREKGRNFIPLNSEILRNGPETDAEINNILRLDESRLSGKNNENKLWKEIAAASEKIHRLRREGMETGKLRKTIEDALSFKEMRESSQSKEFSNLKEDEKNKKDSSGTVSLKSDDNSSILEETKNEKNLESEVREVGDTKDGSESEKSSKSDYENHLSELFENLNANENKKKDSWKKKKRKDSSRQKRFSKPDVSNKVSKTEVQNTVLKSLTEDNYRSVYSPGIKRRLLSTNNEVEDADNAHKHVNDLNAQEIQEKCAKNAADKCIDPTIVKLFSVYGNEAEKNRARRSLTSAFHSNFKREIDLDESMPNDFQNFLVTSLGGFGSQKREVVKKGEALWEGKEMTQDNYNQIVESGKDANEDSALEKREVSSSEICKSQTYKTPVYFSISNQKPTLAAVASINRADKNMRPDDATMIKLKPSKFTDEKLPTHIRIQITNTSSKQKKSSKPIMDENETTSTEIENLPKEKEFFDKNKLNSILSKNYMKLRQHPGAVNSDNDFEDIIAKNLGVRPKPLHPYWWEERKRKKSTAESPMKPVQDFNAFDQKVIESLLQNYQQNHDPDQTAQKISMITRLPQVETVYNPTQGGNKAEIENSRLSKTNAVKSKNALSTKTNLQSSEDNSYDDGFLKSYLKVEKMKSDKGTIKEYEDPEWKMYNRKLNLEQEAYGASSPIMKGQGGDSASFSSSETSPLYLNNYRKNPHGQKLFQTSSNNIFYHDPSGIINPQMLYDVMKLKQQMKNRNSLDKENLEVKPFSKPMFTGENEVQESAQKIKSALSSLPQWLDGTLNNDYSLNKKFFSDSSENKNYDALGIKNQNSQDFGLLKQSFSTDGAYAKNLHEKPSTSETSQINSIENNKDTDYIDGLEDEYPEAESNSEPQADEGLYKVSLKQKNKPHETPGYRRFYNYKNYKSNYKNSELDDNLNEDEEEVDEEYEENGEDDDLEDYSQLGYKKEVEPEMMRFSHDSPKLQNGFHRDINKYYNHYLEPKGNSFEETKINSNSESKNNLASPLEDNKNEPDLISGSNDLLKKANEKANIFGKNLIKKLYGTPSHDEISNRLDKFQTGKSSEDIHHEYRNRLSKRKLDLQEDLKRNYESPQIGSRMFYASKIEVSRDKDLIPSKNILLADKRNIRHTYYRLPERNPFNAEFAGGENDFDHELEEYGIHFNDNFINMEKNGKSEHIKNFEGCTENNSHNDTEFENTEDVEENIEDGGQDNVLENVIGKYIMRKTIKSLSNLNKASEELVKTEETDKNLSDESRNHKLGKRSIEMQGFADKESKVLKKRLSSGHLTENNFRKYHKKNLTKKRHVSNLLSNPYTFTALIDDGENSLKKEKAKEQMKRSALDLFRKITSKDKENKKLENAEGRTAGFEPLLSLNDKSRSFIKESKDTVFLQEKQLSKNNPQAEVKNNLPELKAHYPNEGQRMRAQLMDKKKGKAKEAEQNILTTAAQGPWKVELDDKYDHSDLKKEKSPNTFKDTDKTSLNDQGGRYKTFLLIRNNANIAERNPKSSYSSVSGLFDKETGTSYRPTSGECTRYSINHVRKRSLKSSTNRLKTNDENVSQTSGDRLVKATNVENNINLQEKSRTLQNSKSPTEGDFKFQAPQVVQRSTKKNRSFVTTLDQKRNSQFFSKGNFTNRKFLFPSSSAANIIRDSRHINEETSEYHSQRIVDAILSQVSENSKFKELIAPGLPMRTPAHREGTDSKSKSTTEMKFSEELQSFLQKFMFDLENLAEQHVKKRMCNKIDKDLKQFLQSLLTIPVGNVKDNVMSVQEEKCSLLPLIDTPERKNLSQIDQNSHESKQNVLNNLREKQYLLKKLIENYRNLSQTEKDTLHESYPFLLQELEEAKGELRSLKNESCLVPSSDYCENNYNETNLTTNNSGLNDEKPETGSKSSNSTGFEALKTPEPEEPNFKSNLGSESDSKTEPKKQMSVFYFTALNDPNQEVIKTTPSAFENIVSVNDTIMKNNNSDNIKTQNESQSDFKDFEQNNPTPESFDLLPFQTSTMQSEFKTKDKENIRTKQFSANNKRLIKRSERKKIIDKNFLNQPLIKSTELRKLNLRGALGVNHALKNRGSWVSSLKVAKTSANVPSISQSKTISSQEKYRIKKNGDSIMDISSVKSFKNPRNSVESSYDYLNAVNRGLKIENAAYFPKKSHLIWSTYKKIYFPKTRPFDAVSKNELFMKSFHKCRPQFLFIKAPLSYHKKHTVIGSKLLAQPYGQRKQCRESKFLKRQNWMKRKKRGSSFSDSLSKKIKKEDYGEKGGNLLDWGEPPESVFESPSTESQPVIYNPPSNESDNKPK